MSMQKSPERKKRIEELKHDLSSNPLFIKLQLLEIEEELWQCDLILNYPDDYTGTQLTRAQERKQQIIDHILEGTKLLNA